MKNTKSPKDMEVASSGKSRSKKRAVPRPAPPARGTQRVTAQFKAGKDLLQIEVTEVPDSTV